MKNIINLNIEGYEADLKDGVNILINKQIDDIMSPGSIKSNTSRTISLPNSDMNNKLFGFIFSNQKIISYNDAINIANNFNPSKKANYILSYNGMFFETGYMKLNDIVFKSSNLWNYNITLFSEVVDLFNSYEDEDLKTTLSSDLAVHYQADKYWKINSQIVYDNFMQDLTNQNSRFLNSWIYNNNSLDLFYNNMNSSLGSTLSSYEHNLACWIDAENGVFSGNNKAYFANSWDQVDIVNDYTEQFMRTRNSIKQRLAAYNDLMIYDSFKTKGYTLKLNTDFVNYKNPYWFKSMLTLPLLKDIDEVVQPSTLDSPFRLELGTTYATTKYFKLGINQSSLDHSDYGIISGTTYFENGVTYDTFKISKNQKVNDGVLNIIFSPVTTSLTLNDYGLTGNNEVVTAAYNKYLIGLSGSTTVMDATTNFNLYDNSCHIYFEIQLCKVNAGRTSSTIIETPLYWDLTTAANTIQASGSTTNTYQFYGSIRRSYGLGMTTLCRIDTDYWSANRSVVELADMLTLSNIQCSLNNNQHQVYEPSVLDQEYYLRFKLRLVANSYLINNGSTIQWNVNSIEPFLCQPPCTISYTPSTALKTNSSWNLVDNLAGIQTKKYLLDYIKLFGLYLDIDYFSKQIELKTRNEFYENYKILDWTDKVDLSKEIKITPLVFDKQMIKISYGSLDNNVFSGTYKNKYNKEYASKYLNTGYQFNNDEFDMLNSMFKPCIMSDITSTILGYEPASNGRLIPHMIDNTKSNVDAYSLIFFNGYKPQPTGYINNSIDKIHYVIADGLAKDDDGFYAEEQPHNLSDFAYTISQSGEYKLRRVSGFTYQIKPDLTTYYVDNIYRAGQLYYDTRNNFYYKSFGSYVTSGNTVQYSMDIFKPSSLYFDTVLNYSEDTTIYNRFHKKYLEDRYSINTRTLEANFKLDVLDILNFKFKDFIKYDNCLWTVEKIIDFNLTDTDKTTKVRLIKVNDINNYVNGQNIDWL